MAAKNPRVHTVLEAPLYRVVAKLAREEGLSMSQKVRDLVRDAVAQLEDLELAAMAEERRATFHPRRALTLKDLRRRLKIR